MLNDLVEKLEKVLADVLPEPVPETPSYLEVTIPAETKATERSKAPKGRGSTMGRR